MDDKMNTDEGAGGGGGVGWRSGVRDNDGLKTERGSTKVAPEGGKEVWVGVNTRHIDSRWKLDHVGSFGEET